MSCSLYPHLSLLSHSGLAVTDALCSIYKTLAALFLSVLSPNSTPRYYCHRMSLQSYVIVGLENQSLASVRLHLSLILPPLHVLVTVFRWLCQRKTLDIPDLLLSTVAQCCTFLLFFIFRCTCAVSDSLSIMWWWKIT